MLIPRDRPVYTNLSTSFVDFEELLRDLESRKLTGALRLTARGASGLVLFHDGIPQNALVELPGSRSFGVAAADAIAERARERDGTVSVYALAPELVGLLARAVEGELLYGNLSTAFTSFERLLTKLETEHHTGYAEVVIGDGDGVGMIFLENGVRVDAVLVTEGQTRSGVEIITEMLKAAEERGAVCHVFRAGEQAVRASSEPRRMPASIGAAEVIAAWEDILTGTEEVVDDLGGPGTFVRAFKQTMIDHAGRYPFLDPFAAEFEYVNGAIRFEGALPETFSQALGDCLADTVSRVAFQLKRADLETRVRQRNDQIAERHAAAFERCQLNVCTQELVA